MKIAYFSWISFCVEEAIVWIISFSFCSIVKNAIKVLPKVLHYLLKFHKRHVLFKVRKLNICLFAYFILFGGESNCLEILLLFCTIVIKSRKLTPRFWETYLCFYLVFGNCLFFISFVLSKRLFETFCILFCSISQGGDHFVS